MICCCTTLFRTCIELPRTELTGGYDVGRVKCGGTRTRRIVQFWKTLKIPDSSFTENRKNDLHSKRIVLWPYPLAVDDTAKNQYDFQRRELSYTWFKMHHFIPQLSPNLATNGLRVREFTRFWAISSFAYMYVIYNNNGQSNLAKGDIACMQNKSCRYLLSYSPRRELVLVCGFGHECFPWRLASVHVCPWGQNCYP